MQTFTMTEVSQAMRVALTPIISERHRQDAKWSKQYHDPVYWAGILTEELGEVAKEAIEIAPCAARGDRTIPASLARYRAELIQLAAVAIAAIEHVDDLLADFREG